MIHRKVYAPSGAIDPEKVIVSSVHPISIKYPPPSFFSQMYNWYWEESNSIIGEFVG